MSVHPTSEPAHGPAPPTSPSKPEALITTYSPSPVGHCVDGLGPLAFCTTKQPKPGKKNQRPQPVLVQQKLQQLSGSWISVCGVSVPLVSTPPPSILANAAHWVATAVAVVVVVVAVVVNVVVESVMGTTSVDVVVEVTVSVI